MRHINLLILASLLSACGGSDYNSSKSPTAMAVTPANNSTGVAANVAIVATFSEPVSGETLTVACSAPCTNPSGHVALDITGKIATFTPTSSLTSGTVYTATANGRSVATGLSLASPFVWSFTTIGSAAGGMNLGSAASFGAFGGTAGLTNQGTLTTISGDLGTTAISTAVTGFHDAGPGCVYTETPLNIGADSGKINTAAPAPSLTCSTEGTAATALIAANALADMRAAYNALVAMPAGPDPGAGNLGTLVLSPGVYTSASGSFMVQGGDLTLDAHGDANAVFVFQMATTLTVGGPGAAFPQSITLVNGAQAKNVFWQVGSAATINAGGGRTMEGTIISQAGASLSTAGNVAVVTLNGRVLSLGAVVTLVNTAITVPL
jgi:Ice-binding-like/Bacterial Ig-like domain